MKQVVVPLKIQFEGSDAPEMGQLYGDTVKIFMESFIIREATVVSNGVDRYGRTMGTLFVEGSEVNLKHSEGYSGRIY